MGLLQSEEARWLNSLASQVEKKQYGRERQTNPQTGAGEKRKEEKLKVKEEMEGRE